MAPSPRKDRAAREARERARRYEARQQVHRHKVERRKRDNALGIGALLVVATLATVAQVFYFTDGPGAVVPAPTATESPTAEPTPAAGSNVGDVPDPALAEGREWTGEIVLNDDVELGIALDGSAAPQAVASFVQGVRDGYYENRTCHRLVRSETAGLLQCGSVDGVGGGDPEYSFGPIENAPADEEYPAGTIAMARIGNDAYSQGRQFFVVFEDTALPADAAGGYTVLGQVTSGLDDLIERIAAEGIQAGASEFDGAPVVPTTITGANIS